jgi:hypothetical protein
MAWVARAWGVALVVLALAGCAPALVLHAVVPRPATIPARTFPRVCIAGAADAESRELALGVVAHLAAGPTEVRTVSDADLLACVRDGGAAAVGVRFAVRTDEDLRAPTAPVPMLECPTIDPCSGFPMHYPSDLRMQVGTLEVTVVGPDGATLERVHWVEEESEPEPLAARLAVLERLRARACAMVDQHDEVVELELVGLESEPGRAALDLARSGRIADARVALEQALGTLDGAAAPVERARTTFDLAQLVRVDVDASAADPVAEERSRLERAEQLIGSALALDGDARFERALAQLRAERTARDDVRAQHAATTVNFGH